MRSRPSIICGIGGIDPASRRYNRSPLCRQPCDKRGNIGRIEFFGLHDVEASGDGGDALLDRIYLDHKLLFRGITT